MMYTPKTTYRIQFNKNFTLKALDKLIPYLVKLGIDTIYASPIFEAVPGSTHGYDVTNPQQINPEIGTLEELKTLAKKLKQRGIGWLQDIVPNHMAFHPDNAWLMDVLEKGKQSSFAKVFDIDLSDGQKLMVPFLGECLEEAVAQKLLKLVHLEGKFFLEYGGANWPICAASEKLFEAQHLVEVNNNTALLLEIAQAQYYRLCDWQETNSSINYRRFFTINGLICLNIQDLSVFKLYHKLIFELVQEGVFQGLRVDHIDGLSDPEEYTNRLRAAVGEDIYIVVEKILATGEALPSSWKVQGTTGYDFLAWNNNLLSNKTADEPLHKLYSSFTRKNLNPVALAYEKKRSVLYNSMHGELDNLFRQLIADATLISKEELETVGAAELKETLAEWLIHMPVYRLYKYTFPLSGEAYSILNEVFKALKSCPGIDTGRKVLKRIFFEKPKLGNTVFNQRLGTFFQRCMQFTGPLTAKGIEDTLMFTYNRFIGHTEVGDSPLYFGITKKQFHQTMISRQELWPLSMNASSTHDTKKGEDVRARLNVITDLPEAFAKLIKSLNTIVAAFQNQNPLFRALHHNDLFLIYQTVLGILPMQDGEKDQLEDRIAAFVEKALREAKKRSDWADPNSSYEQKLIEFTQLLLNPHNEAAQQILKFKDQSADFGIQNSLIQLVLKFCCPGIPDVYQGTELWDLSLVDPDNRRAVDYTLRRQLLNELKTDETLKNLWIARYNGKIKLWLLRRLTAIRSEYAAVFERGKYIPIQVKGKYKKNILAFARQEGQDWILTVLPLGMASISASALEKPGNFNWKNTRLILPEDMPTQYHDLLRAQPGAVDVLGTGLLVKTIFLGVPLAVMHFKTAPEKRSAGILLHLSALPSAYTIGDMGPEAHHFVDFLHTSKQGYWQLLPLNPTKASNAHSPYSCTSAFAGNLLLISPELLVQDKLIRMKDLPDEVVSDRGVVKFEEAKVLKSKLLKLAHKNFLQNGDGNAHQQFSDFCIHEKDWLDDYALFETLKEKHGDAPWYEWPREYKLRDPDQIKTFTSQNINRIQECKWQQYIFFKQWNGLKKYANQKGIRMIGDLPFYLDYDACDVWANPGLFMLDADQKPTQVAGVPPDYFNDQGQLWGMPVFNWPALKATNYAWWAARLERNTRDFDLIRLDHFRAFFSYWSVKAGEQTAEYGEWVEGPGRYFFEVIQKQLGTLPFIAEDLGEITNAVMQLRDEFGLPGMKVIQFAFGDDMLSSVHLPNNYPDASSFAYSGTHDNNTLKGWFKDELNKKGKKRVEMYSHQKLKAKNIAQHIIEMLYASKAGAVLVSMQDVLQMGSKSRMNLPGTLNGNWIWRLEKEDLNEKTADWLKLNARLYGRTD